MKIKINYSIKKLLMDNLIYILVFLALNLILTISGGLFISQYLTYNKKVRSLKKELIEYNKRKELINFKNQVVEAEVDLDHINNILNQLIPTKEDYFSIIATLEQLSVNSNFIITSYNILIDDSTAGIMTIAIEGQGDSNAFLDFLKDYNFSGGRLITIDKIEFSQESFTGAKININVYSGKTELSKSAVLSEEFDRELLEKILEKVSLEIKTENTAAVDYPTKSAPF